MGCVGPVYYNMFSHTFERPRVYERIDENCMAVKNIITSSMMCNYGDLKDLNFWNEKIFLDMADWDLCWRMKRNGKICCMIENIILEHSVGEGKKKIGFIGIHMWKPIRDYYQTRDGLSLIKEKYTPIRLKFRIICMIFVRPIIYMLIAKDKKLRMKYIMKGIHDYKVGCFGEFREKEKV